MGSGTTGKVCDELVRNFVGYDLKKFQKLKSFKFAKLIS